VPLSLVQYKPLTDPYRNPNESARPSIRPTVKTTSKFNCNRFFPQSSFELPDIFALFAEKVFLGFSHPLWSPLDQILMHIFSVVHQDLVPANSSYYSSFSEWSTHRVKNKMTACQAKQQHSQGFNHIIW
jgi:hypothetical protein